MQRDTTEEKIDYSLIRRNPKVFAGYSDITAMHLAIQKQTGLVTFHSPVVLSRFTDWTQDHFRKAIFTTEAKRVIANPEEPNPLRPAHPWRAIRPGKVRGQLIGGNLTLVSSLMGTPYEPDTRGKIFFIEDVGEEPYRIDRMLTHLRLSCSLAEIEAMIVGHVNGGEASGPDPAAVPDQRAVVEDSVAGFDWPLAWGLAGGHLRPNLTLPLGLTAALEMEDLQLWLGEG